MTPPSLKKATKIQKEFKDARKNIQSTSTCQFLPAYNAGIFRVLVPFKKIQKRAEKLRILAPSCISILKNTL